MPLKAKARVKVKEYVSTFSRVTALEVRIASILMTLIIPVAAPPDLRETVREQPHTAPHADLRSPVHLEHLDIRMVFVEHADSGRVGIVKVAANVSSVIMIIIFLHLLVVLDLVDLRVPKDRKVPKDLIGQDHLNLILRDPVTGLNAQSPDTANTGNFVDNIEVSLNVDYLNLRITSPPTE